MNAKTAKFNERRKRVKMNFLGIDIGGTKVAVCIGNEAGEIKASRRVSATGHGGPEGAMQRMADTAKAVVAEVGMSLDDIDAVGIGCPGPIDLKKKILISAPNLQGWRNVPVGDFFSAAFARPVFLNNDANGAGLAEYFFGAQKGKDLIYLTMSTGIGAGIMVNGELLSGANSLGGEVGHLTLDLSGPRCGCGKTGCWEAFCGGKNMADQLRADIVANNIQTAVLSAAGGDPTRISMKEICTAVRAGDAYAVAHWDGFIEKMAHGVGILLQSFNPDAIVMGTIAIYDGDLFIPQMITRIPRYAWESALDACTIEASQLTNIGELSALAIAIAGVRHSKKG